MLQTFGYNPAHSLADILSSVVDYYRTKAISDAASNLPFPQTVPSAVPEGAPVASAAV